MRRRLFGMRESHQSVVDDITRILLDGDQLCQRDTHPLASVCIDIHPGKAESSIGRIAKADDGLQGQCSLSVACGQSANSTVLRAPRDTPHFVVGWRHSRETIVC